MAMLSSPLKRDGRRAWRWRAAAAGTGLWSRQAKRIPLPPALLEMWVVEPVTRAWPRAAGRRGHRPLRAGIVVVGDGHQRSRRRLDLAGCGRCTTVA